MPFYEYECTECSARHEVFQKMSDSPLTECSTCGGPIRRVIFAAGIILKGGGFYATEYGKTKKSAASDSSSNGNGKADKTDGADKTGTKSDGSKSSGDTTSAAATPASSSSTTPSATREASPPTSKTAAA